MSSNQRYTVDVNWDETTGVIESTVYSEFQDVRSRVIHQVMETQDEMVRLALQKLGFVHKSTLQP